MHNILGISLHFSFFAKKRKKCSILCEKSEKCEKGILISKRPFNFSKSPPTFPKNRIICSISWEEKDTFLSLLACIVNILQNVFKKNTFYFEGA